MSAGAQCIFWVVLLAIVVVGAGFAFRRVRRGAIKETSMITQPATPAQIFQLEYRVETCDFSQTDTWVVYKEGKNPLAWELKIDTDKKSVRWRRRTHEGEWEECIDPRHPIRAHAGYGSTNSTFTIQGG